jgi:SWI/SNF-related matrix-associated actin-dependent regulator of chromatin subfamily A member 5
MVNQLHRILRPFMLRRLKADVAKDLPPKIKTNLFVGMTEMQREVYKLVLRREVDVLSQAGKSGGRTKLSNILMQLRKACNHPYLFEGVEDRGLSPMGEHLIQNCGKLQLLDKLLGRLKEEELVVVQLDKGHRTYDPETGEELFRVCVGSLYGHPSAGVRWAERRNEYLMKEFNNESWSVNKQVLPLEGGAGDRATGSSTCGERRGRERLPVVLVAGHIARVPA